MSIFFFFLYSGLEPGNRPCRNPWRRTISVSTDTSTISLRLRQRVGAPWGPVYRGRTCHSCQGKCRSQTWVRGERRKASCQSKWYLSDDKWHKWDNFRLFSNTVYYAQCGKGSFFVQKYKFLKSLKNCQFYFCAKIDYFNGEKSKYYLNFRAKIGQKLSSHAFNLAILGQNRNYWPKNSNIW